MDAVKAKLNKVVQNKTKKAHTYGCTLRLQAAQRRASAAHQRNDCILIAQHEERVEQRDKDLRHQHNPKESRRAARNKIK